MRSLFINGEMTYLLNLENIYPKSIRITWRCGVGGSEDMISPTKSPTLADNFDRTYSVSSEVQIPEDRHKDPGFTVRVTWEHESMERPESRKLSIRDSDYRWRPVVGEIQIPRLVHGVPAVLQCDISGYFPNAIDVKWQRHVGQQFYLDSAPDVISGTTVDNTYSFIYSCTVHLPITPTLEEHQGAEYVCFVFHPTLKDPIKRSTGRLQVIGVRYLIDNARGKSSTLCTLPKSKHLKGTEFHTISDAMAATDDWFEAKPKSFCLQDLQNLESRCKKCVGISGEYVE
ncbi:uncharacterized protein [Eleutherodactylus coqui]|uniref:uncharacterized protein n=1 Tax=Eleutherodactylus coqui TaxID=57060 RepID=UPI003461B360